MELKPIGVIRTRFEDLSGMPIQPTGALGVQGQVEVFEEFQDGLSDLDGFSHIILLYHFHQSQGYRLRVVPFLDPQPRGLFATRAPKRPNPIGLSIVGLDKVAGNTLYIRNADMLDGTPLLDIKPYVPAFDAQIEVRSGWLEHAASQAVAKKSDDRFK